MATLKEEAKAYEPQHTKNIADLEAVSIEQEIKKETRKNKENEEYAIAYINVGGLEYRVPATVLEQLQDILLEKPDLKTFKVTKKGEGLNTKYAVIQLE